MQEHSSCSIQNERDGILLQYRNAVGAATVIAAGFAVVLLLGLYYQDPARPATALSVQNNDVASVIERFCNQLPGTHKQLCSAYTHASTAEQKWSAASMWRRTSPASFECAGIHMDCLQADLARGTAGSSCKPLPENTSCGSGKQCTQGFCGGPPAEGESQQDTAAELQQQQQQQDEDDLSEAARVITTGHELPELSANNSASALDEPDARILRMASSKSMKSKTSMTALNSMNINLDKPVPAWPTAAASVNSGPLGARVTDTFLATSHEYTRIMDYGDERIVHAWAKVFGMLSPSPVIRVGGASQDKLTRVPGPATWIALKKLRRETNCRFLLGLPLFPKNSIDMSKKMIADAKKYLGDSVIGFELGNEPEYWPLGLGGWSTDGKWQSGFDAYAKYFHRVALAINPCKSGYKMLSGPGWGNLNTQPVSWLAKIMYQGKGCYLQELTVHYYPYVDLNKVTAGQLLSQQLQDWGLAKYKDYQRIANKEKMGIRISETNSLYGGGRPSLSDTLVGALWVADALFAFANAGATAFHLHWGVGGSPTEDLGSPNTGVQTNFAYNVRPKEPPLPYPSIHAPWYGYLFWTIAAAGDYQQHTDANFVPAKINNRGKCGANLKIWALKADKGDLRIVFLNKDEALNCNVKVMVDKPYCGSPASLARLLSGPSGIFSKGDEITWQGQTYANAGFSGQIQGQKQVQVLKPQLTKDPAKCRFEVPIPYASGGVLIAKRSASG